MFGIAWIAGPLLGTNVYANHPDALWIACGVVGLVGAGLALAAGRQPAPFASGGEVAAAVSP